MLELTLCRYVCVLSRFSGVWLFVTPWITAFVHGIFLARILGGGEVVMPSSRGSFQPRNQTHMSCVSYIAGGFFTTEPLRKPSVGTSSLTYVTYLACSVCLCLCICSSIHPFTSTFLVHQFLFFKEQRLAHDNHLKKNNNKTWLNQ